MYLTLRMLRTSILAGDLIPFRMTGDKSSWTLNAKYTEFWFLKPFELSGLLVHLWLVTGTNEQLSVTSLALSMGKILSPCGTSQIHESSRSRVYHRKWECTMAVTLQRAVFIVWNNNNATFINFTYSFLRFE
jgi:hypothetical protein